MKLSVISPTYNESGNVVQLIQQLETALQGLDYEIIISDDNSPDLTWSLVEKIAGGNPRVRLLRRMGNRGLGPSVIDGFSCATGEAVACIDADLQHDPAILPAMFKNLVSGSELVVGSRYIAGGSTGQWGRLRQLESMIATKMAQWSVSLRICDPMSGYFMMWRSDFMRVRGNLNGRGFKILLEIAAALKPRSVCEVPYTFRTRAAGKSKLSGKVVWAYLAQLLRMSRLGKLVPAEFIKFAIVGGSGVLVNLGVMAAILHLTSYHDWRSSAMASVSATLSNYILNNFWTFRDRAHNGMTFVSRYIYYLLASLVGLTVTTGTFVAISWVLGQALGLARNTARLPTATLLLCQLVAVVAGTFSNYRLNRSFTWPKESKGSSLGLPVSHGVPVEPAGTGSRMGLEKK